MFDWTELERLAAQVNKEIIGTYYDDDRGIVMVKTRQIYYTPTEEVHRIVRAYFYLTSVGLFELDFSEFLLETGNPILRLIRVEKSKVRNSCYVR